MRASASAGDETSAAIPAPVPDPSEVPTMHRRTVAVAASVLLSGPLLAACGFDYPTDRVNTNAAGVTDRSGAVDVVGFNVVAGTDGAGNLIGSLSNNADEDDALVGVAGDDATASAAAPVELGPSGTAASTVNLAELVRDGTPVALTGDFGAGEVITLTLSFQNADDVEVDVPVVKPCYQYEGLDAAADPTPSEPPSDGGGGGQGGGSTDEPSETPTSASPSESADDDELAEEPEAAYSCEPPVTPSEEE